MNIQINIRKRTLRRKKSKAKRKKKKISESYEKMNLEKKFDEKNQSEFYFYHIIPEFSEVCKTCELKRKNFVFNNEFHRHIRSCSEEPKKINNENVIFDFSIIRFIASNSLKNGFSFKSYH